MDNKSKNKAEYVKPGIEYVEKISRVFLACRTGGVMGDCTETLDTAAACPP